MKEQISDNTYVDELELNEDMGLAQRARDLMPSANKWLELLDRPKVIFAALGAVAATGAITGGIVSARRIA